MCDIRKFLLKSTQPPNDDDDDDSDNNNNNKKYNQQGHDVIDLSIDSSEDESYPLLKRQKTPNLATSNSGQPSLTTATEEKALDTITKTSVLSRQIYQNKINNSMWYKAPGARPVNIHGITRLLSTRYYPEYVFPGHKRGSGSSIKVGKLVHRQLYHLIECLRREQCDCTTRTNLGRLNKMTVQAIDASKALQLSLRRAEVLIAWPEAGIGTRLDIFAYRWEGTTNERTTVVSIKTGYTSGYNVNRHGDKMQPPFDDILSTPRNHNQLQGMTELLILEQAYGVKVDDYMILYLGQGDDGKEYKVEYLDTWCKERDRKLAFVQSLLLTNNNNSSSSSTNSNRNSVY